jgi:hypothetical protein
VPTQPPIQRVTGTCKASGAWSWPLTSSLRRGQENMDLYILSLTQLHRIVLNYLSTGRILPLNHSSRSRLERRGDGRMLLRGSLRNRCKVRGRKKWLRFLVLSVSKLSIIQPVSVACRLYDMPYKTRLSRKCTTRTSVFWRNSYWSQEQKLKAKRRRAFNGMCTRCYLSEGFVTWTI